MDFEFSKHSLEQMDLSSIETDTVEWVMDNPDVIITNEDGQAIHQKLIGLYLYRVFANPFKTPALIKTVYKTSNIIKYT